MLSPVCVSVEIFSRTVCTFVGTNIVSGKFVDKIKTHTLSPVQL